MSEYIFIAILFFAALVSPVGIFIILHKPRIFFAIYLLLATRMFGFMPMVISLHVKAILFFLHWTMILAVVALFLKGRNFSGKTILLLLACVSGLIAFGILYPYCLGFSNIHSAIVDGKEMFGYAILAYLFIHSRRFDFNYFLKFFCFLSAVLTGVLIAGHIFGFCPPGYTRVEGTNIIHIHYASFLSLAACLMASRMLRARISFHTSFLFLFIMTGLFIQGHRAICLATLVAVFFLWLLRASFPVKLRYVFIGIPLLLIFYLPSIGRHFETRLVEPVSELRDSAGAIASRNLINAVRFRYFVERPLLGYGFIDETSFLGRRIAKQSVSRFGQSLGVVDSGYTDMLVRFGIIGTFLFCSVLGFIIFDRFRNMRQLTDAQLAMLLVLAGFFVVNYTWSVFTYGFGISCVCIAIFMLYREKPVRWRIQAMAPRQEYV